jgi:hypothetical protein
MCSAKTEVQLRIQQLLCIHNKLTSLDHIFPLLFDNLLSSQISRMKLRIGGGWKWIRIVSSGRP